MGLQPFEILERWYKYLIPTLCLGWSLKCKDVPSYFLTCTHKQPTLSSFALAIYWLVFWVSVLLAESCFPRKKDCSCRQCIGTCPNLTYRTWSFSNLRNHPKNIFKNWKQPIFPSSPLLKFCMEIPHQHPHTNPPWHLPVKHSRPQSLSGTMAAGNGGGITGRHPCRFKNIPQPRRRYQNHWNWTMNLVGGVHLNFSLFQWYLSRRKIHKVIGMQWINQFAATKRQTKYSCWLTSQKPAHSSKSNDPQKTFYYYMMYIQSSDRISQTQLKGTTLLKANHSTKRQFFYKVRLWKESGRFLPWTWWSKTKGEIQSFLCARLRMKKKPTLSSAPP